MSLDATPGDGDTWRAVVAHVAEGCAAAGLDLVHPLRADWYDGAVAPAHALPDVGRRDALAILIASSRALWPRFVDAIRREPARLDGSDPLDQYVGEAVGAVVRSLRERLAVRAEMRLAHELPPRRIAIQRLADVSGLARLAPSHLNVHPTYGPWIGLRGVVVAGVAGPAGAPPRAVDPCGGCEERCLAALARAEAQAGGGCDPSSLIEHWRAWLAVREACPTGAMHRYDESEIRYHYTKDRGVLLELAGIAGGARR